MVREEPLDLGQNDLFTLPVGFAHVVVQALALDLQGVVAKPPLEHAGARTGGGDGRVEDLLMRDVGFHEVSGISC